MGLFGNWFKKEGGGDGPEGGPRPGGASPAALELALGAAELSESDAVLQIEFGDGELLRRFIPRLGKGRVAGLAKSQAHIEEAMMEFGSATRQFKAEFREGVISKIPFLDHEFTKVYSLDQMHRWINVGSAFREAGRVLAPGGLFILIWASGLSGRNAPGREAPALSPEEVRALLAQASLSVVRQGESHDEQFKYYLSVAEKKG